MQRKFSFAIGEYYHLYNRGNDKRPIFLDNGDRLRFLALLYLANSNETVHLSDHQGKSLTELLAIPGGKALVSIGAFCLMPNHFHLLVKEETEGGTSVFMKKLLTGYSMYFNKKYQRTGKLFEGPFRATHAAEDSYLRYLFAYIHLNPIKIKDPDGWGKKNIMDPDSAYQFLRHYQFSSMPDYLDLSRAERIIISPEAFPDYFEGFQEFGDFIKEWIAYDPNNA